MLVFGHLSVKYKMFAVVFSRILECAASTLTTKLRLNSTINITFAEKHCALQIFLIQQ